MLNKKNHSKRNQLKQFESEAIAQIPCVLKSQTFQTVYVRVEKEEKLAVGSFSKDYENKIKIKIIDYVSDEVKKDQKKLKVNVV